MCKFVRRQLFLSVISTIKLIRSCGPVMKFMAMDSKLCNITILGVAVIISIYATAAFPHAQDNLAHYDGYKVIRISPETVTQGQIINELISQNQYDVWRKGRFVGEYIDVMIPPTEYDHVMEYLQSHGVSHYIMISDVETLLKNERQRMSKRKRDMDWEDYHTWDEVNTWLSNLVSGSVNGSNAIITSEKYGTSLEGRDLLVYKVSSRGGNATDAKQAFWIDATIHAREHITTAVITYMINELVTNTSKYSDILGKVDFYFAPFINPDGFVYSHEVDRMWRKTRSQWTNSTCIGVDANRNYGFHWGDSNGASADPCSSGYHGPEPFSEPEAKYMRDFILDKGQNQNVSWETYVTLHSYGQLWMSPWGYTVEPPADHSEVLQLAKDATDELKRHFNTSYTIGNSGAALYFTSGTSQDWAKGDGGFKYVYTIELRDTGRFGFVLPAEQIEDTAFETWAGIQVVAREMASRQRNTV